MELRTVMLGNAGVGKTATANAILNTETFKETETTECEIKRGRVDSTIISIIDTPGINSATLRSEHLKTEMRRLFSLSDPGPHVFLLVIRVRNFTEDQRNTVEWIQENFGEEALKFTMVLFTGREEISRAQWRKFSEEDRFQEFVGQCGGGYDVINSKKEANRAQIIKLLDKIEKMVQLNGGIFFTTLHYCICDSVVVDGQEVTREDVSRCVETTPEQVPTTPLLPATPLVSPTTLRPRVARTPPFPQEPDSYSEQRIVLLGRPGSGKSSSGNTILKEKNFCVNSTFRYMTKESSRVYRPVNGRTVWVIDTPGLLNGVMTKDELKEQLECAIDLAYPGVHVFLLVMRLDVRFREEDQYTVKWIVGNFGEEIQKHIIVLFTHGNELWKKTIEQYLDGSPELKGVVDSMADYHVFDNRNKDDETQVTQLLEKINRVMDKNENQIYTKNMYNETQRKKQRDMCNML